MDALNADTQAAFTPASALERLREGNARFVGGRPTQRDLLNQVKQTSGGQWPFAAVLSCIDSRVPVEVVFDQGIGDLFSARVAGNVVNDDILGSLEFATKVAGAKLVVVLGHSSCGAVKGACDGVELGHLTGLLAKVGPALSVVTEPSDPAQRTASNADFVADVTRANIAQAVADVSASPTMAALIESGDLAVVGALYDVATGAVEFLGDA